MIIEDTFGCPLEVGALVTYAMKRDGGIVFPVCRISGVTEAGWLQLKFEPSWLKEFNTPWVEHMLKATKDGDVHPDKLTQLMKNILSTHPRNVSPMSVIRIDKHPAFEHKQNIKKFECMCGGGAMGHDRDCPKYQVNF